MDLILNPCKLKGKWQAPPSKAVAHRIMISRFISCGEIPQLCFCDDTKATYDALCEIKKALAEGGSSLLFIDCKDSASTLRFLLPVVCACGLSAVFTGSPQLAVRPISELVCCLARHGCLFSQNKLPLSTKGKLQPGLYKIQGNVSSQYLSGLFYASKINGGILPVAEGELQSAGYLDLTQGVFANPVMEGCWSAAANFEVANFLGAEIELQNLNPDSLQPDRAIIDKLKDLGGTIDISDCPDLGPILFVADFIKNAKTKFTGTERLRLKETDRLNTSLAMLNGLEKGLVDCAGDHRIAMAAAIGASFMDHPVKLCGTECVSKSYPDFFKDYDLLRR